MRDGSEGRSIQLKARLSVFTSWPGSHKLLLLGSVGVLATLMAELVNAVVFSSAQPSAMRLDLLNGYMAVWIVAQAAVTALSVPAALAGTDGKWAARVFVMVQSPFIVGLLQLFGTMSTPLVAIYPAIVILWTLVLDERIGLFGFCNLVTWILLAGLLESLHLLPYAPVLGQRVIDAQNDPVWFAAVSFHILVLLAFCISLCVLFQRTLREREASARTAHLSLERALRLIRRYVPPQLAEQITSGHYIATARPERRKLTIVFVGVDLFASATEELEAEDLASILAEYLSEMVAIADRHGGTVNQMFGDAIMIFFGAPQVTDDRDHALRAVRMAMDMQARVAEMQDMWSRHGLDRPFRIRIGINTGFASVGDFGSEGRKLYSGIGLQTNLAERIQAKCEPGKILVSHPTWALVGDSLQCESSRELSIAGANHPLRVYQLAASDAPHSGPVAAVAEPAALMSRPPAGPATPSKPVEDSARSPGSAARVWAFGDAHFDEARLEFRVGGVPVELERKPLEVLRYLLLHAGDMVTKDQLMHAVWPGRILSDTVIAKCVSRLREALHDNEQSVIKTIHGYGYRFVAEIRTSNPG